MSGIRIPVSLKFDTESEFYNDFILDMRENRTLAGFIVDILRAYYENEAVQDSVNLVMAENNPFTEIKKQLERIHLEHSKTIMNTSMLADHNSNILTELETEGVTPSQEQAQPAMLTGSQQGGNNLVARIEKIEALLPSIDQKLELLMSKLTEEKPTGGKVEQVQSEPTYQETSNATKAQATPISEPETQPIEKVEKPTPLEPTPSYSPPQEPQIEEKEDEEPLVFVGGEQQTSTAPIIMMDDDEEEEEDSITPPSFGLALKSLKKK